MKTMPVRTLTILPAFFLSFLFLEAQPPTHTAHFEPQLHSNINGFWEYLPLNYQQDVDQHYPLLIFLHGAGEQGEVQDQETIAKVLRHGTPKLINEGGFPQSFIVGGKTLRFIVISPQIKNGIENSTSIIEPDAIQSVINYAKNNYRVDPARIYVAGLSMGGGATWDFAGSSQVNSEQIAAMAIACGAGDVTSEEAAFISRSNIPIIATHNRDDGVVEVNRTINNIAEIENVQPGISPSPRTVYWNNGPNGDGHNVWTRTFEEIAAGTTSGGNLTDSAGMNVYQWFLQFSTSQQVLAIEWESFNVNKEGNAVHLHWEIGSSEDVVDFVVQRSVDGRVWNDLAHILPPSSVTAFDFTDPAPAAGNNYYRILEIERSGYHGYSETRLIQLKLDSRVLIYPNPFRTSFRIQSVSGLGSISITDVNGRKVFEQQFRQQGISDLQIHQLAGLPRGTYILQIRNTGAELIATQHIIKN